MLKNTSSHDPTQPEGPTTDLATSPCRNLLSVEELILPPLLRYLLITYYIIVLVAGSYLFQNYSYY